MLRCNKIVLEEKPSLFSVVVFVESVEEECRVIDCAFPQRSGVAPSGMKGNEKKRTASHIGNGNEQRLMRLRLFFCCFCLHMQG